MNTLFYATGLIVWALLLATSVLLVSVLLWCHLSTAVAYWWVRVRAEKFYPGNSSLKKSFTKNKLWRMKLLWLMLISVTDMAELKGTKTSDWHWSADFTGWWPKVNVIKPETPDQTGDKNGL